MDSKKEKKYSIIFRCAVPKCPYTTQRLYNLHRHNKTHTRSHWHSKRFPCPFCAYAAATRAHVKRHIGKKHPTEDISKLKLIGLAYEEFEDKTPEPEEISAQPEVNILAAGQEEQIFEGPVTVLQMVTPLSQESELLPGALYCNSTLEGEAFRLIPVAIVPGNTENTEAEEI